MGPGREWLVIESTSKRSVFRNDGQRPSGYIPRDAAEAFLGRSMEGVIWFTAELAVFAVAVQAIVLPAVIVACCNLGIKARRHPI